MLANVRVYFKINVLHIQNIFAVNITKISFIQYCSKQINRIWFNMKFKKEIAVLLLTLVSSTGPSEEHSPTNPSSATSLTSLTSSTSATSSTMQMDDSPMELLDPKELHDSPTESVDPKELLLPPKNPIVFPGGLKLSALNQIEQLAEPLMDKNVYPALAESFGHAISCGQEAAKEADKLANFVYACFQLKGVLKNSYLLLKQKFEMNHLDSSEEPAIYQFTLGCLEDINRSFKHILAESIQNRDLFRQSIYDLGPLSKGSESRAMEDFITDIMNSALYRPEEQHAFMQVFKSCTNLSEECLAVLKKL